MTPETTGPPAKMDAGERALPNEVAVRIEGLHKWYGDVHAVRGLDLGIRTGEFVTLLGASGCGKSTTLRVLAGLETATKGRVEFFGRPVVDADRGLSVPPNRREIGMVFQSYALWPHMTALENVAFPLRHGRPAKNGGARRPTSARDVEDRAKAALARVHCEHLGARYPGEMSGGQQQRVALARAIVSSPQIVLLDEPLSNLDANLRRELRIELRRLQQDIGFTALYVTHDQAEALSMSDRIVLMHEGRAEQVAIPRRLFELPATPYAASFVGSHNLLEGTIADCDPDGPATVRTAIGVVRARPARPDIVPRPGAAALVAVRADRIRIEPRAEAPHGEGGLEERVGVVTVASEYSGAHVDTIVETAAGERITVRDYAGTPPPPSGAAMWVVAVAEAVLTEVRSPADGGR